MVSLMALINLIERHRGGGEAAQGGASKPDRGKENPIGLEQPAPAPPGLYPSKICADELKRP